MTKTVLIVDDSPDGTMLTKMALSKLQIDIRMENVSTGKGALEFLKTAADPPAMILLDLKMPGMSGIETLRCIRADSQLKDIPVVITTLSTMENELEAAREAGATGFIYKAIRLDQFSKDIEHHVTQWIKKV